ncbi:MAG: PspC domain-containing protein [Micromonosporaceae bacterium]|nr:PspC domain-containing protein [Micromonosporaceae bacterium]
MTSAQPHYRRLYRDPDDRIVAGVAAGLAEHLRAPVTIVRLVLVALLAVNGFGGLLYVALWAVVPVRPDAPRRVARRRLALQRVAYAALALGLVILATDAQGALGGFPFDPVVVALAAVVALGAGIIWHQADPQRRRLGRTSDADAAQAPTGDEWAQPEAAVAPARPATRADVEPAPDRRRFLLRVIGGGLLMVVGIIGILGIFAPPDQSVAATLLGLLFAGLALAGLVLALAPVLWRMVGQLREERIARIREQERAEVAAIVHDQVLHTLALIQRHANDPSSVLRLARGQERSLRSWLYRPAASPNERFAAALEQVAGEVEDAYGITVETVVVGDAEHDERVAALVAATREALVNAARHAKVSTVSLYAEVEDDRLTVFVRDRGVGFDMSTVDDDRHGIRGSIIGRMQRHDGTARLRSAPGEGTEVELSIRRGAVAATGRSDLS